MSEERKDNHKKNEEEDFSFNNITDFDHHIDLSIPNYSFVANEVRQLSEYFVQDYTNVYDLGCSTGKFLKELNRKDTVNYYGIDESDNLLPTKEDKNLHFYNEDLIEWDGYENCSFAMSLFTLQFLPLQSRKKVIERISKNLNKGGAFISCEKIYSNSARFQDVTNSIYYEHKNKTFHGNEILEKERDLRKIMKLQTLNQSMKDLECIGPVELFWRSHNFVGLIAIKE